MADKVVSFTYQFRGFTFNGEAEVDEEVWADWDDEERKDYLLDAAQDDFQDNATVVEGSINDEG